MAKQADLVGLGMAPALAGQVSRAAALSEDNVTDDTPSLAQINTAFGTAANVGSGFIGIINDAGGDAKGSLVVSDGTNWWYEALVKAS